VIRFSLLLYRGNSMIQDLDRTLNTLLRQGLTSNITISFATPDDQFPPADVTLPAINFFLYDIRENLELRSTGWLLERREDNRSALKRRPPARVDCSYLITAWPGAGIPQPNLDEHRMLGEVLRVLLRYPMLPTEVLQGSLAGQQPDLPTSVLQPANLQSLGEFWQALGGKPRAVLNYTVTISVDPGLQPEPVPLVSESVLDLRLGAQPE
jgi:hypothetical protein